jgi:hypothetical protein
MAAAALLVATSLMGIGTGPAHAATTINVPADHSTIQAAIEAAANGDTVIVAPGTYHERVDFKGKAIEVKSSAGPATTTIDGDATGITVVFHTQETRASVLRGFTITDGLQPPMQEQLVGGGIAVKDASPTIVGNVVTANVGSGIGVVLGSPLIQDNVITANNTSYDGGGVWAGASSEVVGNRIEGNVAGQAGGVLVLGTAVVRGNVIRGNQAVGPVRGGGGGLAMWGGSVVGNLIADNTATVGENVKGGGVLWRGEDSTQLLQNTFVGNNSPTGSAIGDLIGGSTSGNVIVGPGGVSLVHCSGSPVYFSYNDVFNGTASKYEGCGNPTGSLGNISADPLFVSPTDYRLQPGSPAIDAGGSDFGHVASADLTGGARFSDGDDDGFIEIDMGAYETPRDGIAGSRFHPLPPARILDTRFGVGGPGPLGPDGTLTIQVTGQGGVPVTGVSAVVLNVTVTDTTAPSYLTVWPARIPRPLAANLNYLGGQTVPNLVTVMVSPGGQVSLYNAAGSAHVVADVSGYYGEAGNPYGSRYAPVVPARILDTRFDPGAQPIGPDSTLELQVTGQGGIPATGVSAVVLNVTVTQPTAPSYLTAWPSGASRPLAANLNYLPGQTVPNLVVVKVGELGKISLYNAAGTTHVVADVAGWFPEGFFSGGSYTSLVPARILDTRFDAGRTAIGPDSALELQVTGWGGIPATGVAAVVLNVTVTQPTAPSYLTAWPAAYPRPLAANLNYLPGQTVPNLVVVRLDDDGKIGLYNAAGSTHVVADVAGWFSL